MLAKETQRLSRQIPGEIVFYITKIRIISKNTGSKNIYYRKKYCIDIPLIRIISGDNEKVDANNYFRKSEEICRMRSEENKKVAAIYPNLANNF